MPIDVNRREFLAASAAVLAAGRIPLPEPQHHEAGHVMLFQGDSITDAGRNRDSADPNSAGALGNGYPLLVTAEVLAARPAGQLRFYNRGISGNKVPDLQARWQTDCLDLKPDVLSILIGVNDFWHTLTHGYTGTVQDYEQQYTALLDQTRQALPSVKLIVFEPFVLKTGAVDDRWFPEFDRRRAAAARVAAHARATFVPLQAIFDKKVRSAPPAYWAGDGVHPTPAGHAVIAAEWRRAAGL
ncbi:MAG TPA: SGNH/GDSL hydrolase family protein [Gemmatimonadales bacterium]